jgi:pimeloyl-ACP methyl ester carboxylesterase
MDLSSWWWAPGKSYTITITNPNGIAVACNYNDVFLSAWEWGDAPDYYRTGPPANYIHFSGLDWINSTKATFNVSVDSDAPSADIFFELYTADDTAVWFQVTVAPPPPPPQPSPPGPAPCPTPALDQDTPVTPDTWIPGQKTEITVKGTGFTTQAGSSLPNCPATTITVWVQQGEIDLSNIFVVDSNTITATVTPADTDPAEIATITLWGPAIQSDVVGHRGAEAAPPASGAAATVLRQNPILRISAPVDALSQASNPEASFAMLPQQSQAPQAAPHPAAAQPKRAGTPVAPNGMANDGEATAQIPKLYVIDPYLPPFSGSTNINQSTVISSQSNYSKIQAQGMVTDGSATAIAVLQLPFDKQVTFKGTDGLQFETWQPNFLSYPPSNGNCSGDCSIPVNPIQGSDGNYYAFALVLAPQQSRNTNYGYLVAQVTASVQTASGVAQSDPTKLSIAPTPVIFAHGLWADASTFGEMRTTLSFAEPWQDFIYKYGVLTAICYDATVPFDFGGPVPSNVGRPPSNAYVTANCEQASSTAIDSAIFQVQKSLDTGNIVGGRVDIVAHSMGGLATRHYTATSLYSSESNSARSRSVGPLHTVITLDTPETGSPLAGALLLPAIDNSTCASPLIASSGNLCTPASGTWFEVCPSSAQSTFAHCFAGSTLKKPIGPGSNPETNISPCQVAGQSDSGCGAVASLAPDSPNIAAAPRIDSIQSQYTKWFAIESDWRDYGGNSPSALRSFFNDLLAAVELDSSLPVGICPQTQLARYSTPTLLCLMGDDPDNDVIVPTRSQADDTSGNLVEFFNDAHASLALGNALPQYWTKSDANILDGRADGCVEQILLTSAIQGCSAASPSSSASQSARPSSDEGKINVQAAPGESLEDAIERTSHPMQLNTRKIGLGVAGTTALLGNPIRLHLTAPPGKISTIHYYELAQHGDIDTGDSGIADVVEDEGENKTIEVRPLQLGEIEVVVTVLFADNSTGKQSVKVNVLPSAVGLTQFTADQGFHFVELKLNGSKDKNEHWLVPIVTYSGVKYPIRLGDSSQLSFTIDQSASDPVIEINRDGLIRALRTGDAIITVDFAGVRDQIKVRVSGD